MKKIIQLNLIFVLFFSLIFKSNAQTTSCVGKETCGKCIQSHSSCVWCLDHQFDDYLRCNLQSRLKKLNCNNIYKQTNDVQIIKNDDFSEKTGATIQLKPQKLRIKLKPNTPLKISFQFQQASDYPMDLYYLMDLSQTMQRYIKTVASVGRKLAKAMKDTTGDFRIGFGSFVDKTVMPFSGFGTSSQFPYTFHNRLPLGENPDEFVEKVMAAKTTGNNDIPEGNLDALMQVLACDKQIGWRNQANKIIVVATDEQFHYAGDGKLGGILEPNDGECHLENEHYTFQDKLDYPSMYHIAEKIREKKINVVFAIDEKVNEMYQTLVKIIGPLATISPLKAEDNTIINVIKEVYKSIRSNVEIAIESSPPEVDVELFSSCNGLERYEQRNNCSRFRREDVIQFDAKITLKTCPLNKLLWNNKSLKIGITNIDESIEVELEMACECECERKRNSEENSNKCSGQGTFACGKCSSCNGKRYGKTCECDPDVPIDPTDPLASCRRTNETRICSDRGRCECGQCNCNSGFSGAHCECDDSTCTNAKRPGKLCSDNGYCLCGKCKCFEGFSGEFCDCPLSNSTCVRPGSDQICSGVGACKCGRCDCVGYSGEFCQKCPKCDFCPEISRCFKGVCDQLINVLNCSECSKINVNKSLIIENQWENMTNNCDRADQDKCVVRFSYRVEEEEGDELPYVIVSKPQRICQQPISTETVIQMSVALVSGIILVGIGTLLLWKLLTEILDRRDFAKFQKELAKANWDQSDNPLYKEATSTFQNPAFSTN